MSFDPRLPDDGHNVSRAHPLREAALLVGVVAGLIAAATLVAALAMDRLIPLLPPALEAKLFSPLPSPGGAGAEAGDPRERALQPLLARLARHWPENPYALRLEIWREDTPNALAFPGGLVVVTSGLLERAQSENEVAFVLGHELGHFRNRDHLRGLGRQLAVGLMLAALGEGAAGSAARLASQLTQRGFDREQERAADGFGLALVAAEYGHVAGAADFFRRLDQASAGGVGERVAGYLSTHPLGRDRIAALRAAAAEAGWPERGPLTPLPAADPERAGSPTRESDS